MSIKSFRAGQNRKNTRTVGEAPSLGQVNRIKNNHQPAQYRDEALINRAQYTKRVTITWSITFGILTSLTIAFFILSYFKKSSKTPTPTSQISPADPRATASGGSKPTKKTATITTLDETSAIALVKAALTNADPARVDDLFIRPADIEPNDLIKTLKTHIQQAGKATELTHLGGKILNHGYTEEVLIAFSLDGKTTNRLAQLWQGKDEKWRIDFESFIRRNLSDPATLATGETTTIRIFIAPDTFYITPFSDDAWQCYALVIPGDKTLYYGYAEKASPQLAALKRILGTDRPIKRATIEIENTPGSTPRQFKITRVLAEDWSLGPQPFDETL